MLGEITTSQFVNSPVVVVSFPILENDWCLLQQSAIWNCIQNFLAVSGNKSSQMSQQEKKALLGEYSRFLKRRQGKK